MKHSAWSKLAVVLVVAVMVNAPLYAQSCPNPGCTVGPPLCLDQLLYNPSFSASCAWTAFGSASFGSGVATLTGNAGKVYQGITIGNYPGSTFQLDLDVTITGNSPGTERLVVEILQGLSVTTIASIYPNSGNGRRQFNTNNYSNSSVTVRLRYDGGAAPGNTVFTVPDIYYFVL